MKLCFYVVLFSELLIELRCSYIKLLMGMYSFEIVSLARLAQSWRTCQQKNGCFDYVSVLWLINNAILIDKN